MTERRFYTLCPECNTTHTKQIMTTLFLKGPVEFVTDHCKNCGTPFKTKIDISTEKIVTEPLKEETPLNKEVAQKKEVENGTTQEEKKEIKTLKEGVETIGKITTS